MDTRCVGERASRSACGNSLRRFVFGFGVFAGAGSAERKPPSTAHSLRFPLPPLGISIQQARTRIQKD